MSTYRRITLLGVAIVSVAMWRPAALTAQAPAQKPPPSVTFQVEVNYVDVDTIVTDEKGSFVSDLGRDDFEVFEDGKPQKIDAFSYVEIPVEKENRFLLLGRPVGTDVRSNRQSFSGRVFVIVLDDLNVSPLRGGVVKRSAREFVEQHLGANDLAAVAYTSGHTEASQDFTSDRQLLLASIDKFSGQKFRSAALDELDGYYQNLLNRALHDGGLSETNSGPALVAELGGTGTRKQNDLERNHRALNVLGTLRNLAEYLSSIRGRRKAILFMSEGIDYPIQDVFGARSASNVIMATRDVIDMAARSNVNFFAIDPRGLTGLTTEYIDMQGTEAIMPPGQGALIGAGGPDLNTTTGTMTPLDALLNELRLSQDALKSLAEETGGFAAVNANDLSTTFERIVDNNSRYYVLGYYPPTHARDGRFHKIEVRVKRPGLRVQARRGYASPRGRTPEDRKRDEDARRAREAKRQNADTTSAELRDVLGRQMQQSGLTFTVQAAPFRGAQKNASVALAIEFDGATLDFTPQNNETVFASGLELSMFGINEQGRAQRGTQSNVDLTLKPANYRWVKDHGLRVSPRIDLAPGRYQLRIGARENVKGRVGSVFYDLEVPDFRKDPVMLSGLLLSAASAEDVVTVQPDPVAAKLLPGGATSQRTFVWSDVLTLYAEVYDNVSSQQRRQIDVNVRLTSDTGQEVFAARDTLSNGGTPGTAPWTVHGYTRQIPCKEIPEGRYVLRVEAQVQAIGGNATVAARETVITVRP